MAAESSFRMECSDEETENEFTNEIYLRPGPAEVARLYEAIARDGTVPLAWCWQLGKRPLTPSQDDSESDHEEEVEKVDTSGFDFDDEPLAVRLTPRRTPGGPKGSAKKKTTNFDNILASIKKQKKLEFKERSRIKRDKK